MVAKQHCSWMDRIPWPCSLSTSDAELDTRRLCRATPAHLSRSGIVRCDHIHGVGTNHHALWWRTPLTHQVEMAHQDFCGGRRAVLRYAGVRWAWRESGRPLCVSDSKFRRRNHGPEDGKRSEQRPESHHRRTVRSGHLLRLLPCSCHRLPATHQQEAHHSLEFTPRAMEEAHARPLPGQRFDSDSVNPQARGVRRRQHRICFVSWIFPIHLRLASHVVCDGALQLRTPKWSICITPGWKDVAGVEALYSQSTNSGIRMKYRSDQLVMALGNRVSIARWEHLGVGGQVRTGSTYIWTSITGHQGLTFRDVSMRMIKAWHDLPAYVTSCFYRLTRHMAPKDPRCGKYNVYCISSICFRNPSWSNTSTITSVFQKTSDTETKLGAWTPSWVPRANSWRLEWLPSLFASYHRPLHLPRLPSSLPWHVPSILVCKSSSRTKSSAAASAQNWDGRQHPPVLEYTAAWKRVDFGMPVLKEAGWGEVDRQVRR